MTLSKEKKRELTAKAHSLKPVVIVGTNGITESLLAEVDVALTAHELIKIRLNAENKKTMSSMIEQICKATGADAVSDIGRVGVFYRKIDQTDN